MLKGFSEEPSYRIRNLRDSFVQKSLIMLESAPSSLLVLEKKNDHNHYNYPYYQNQKWVMVDITKILSVTHTSNLGVSQSIDL